MTVSYILGKFSASIDQQVYVHDVTLRGRFTFTRESAHALRLSEEQARDLQTKTPGLNLIQVTEGKCDLDKAMKALFK